MTIKKFSSSSKNQAAFTIVELLIVVVVIAILAAITIVAYNGITNRAIDAGIRSDLTTAAKKLGVYQVSNDTYPSITQDAGFQPPSSVTSRYVSSRSTFCLTYKKGSLTYSVTELGVVMSGPCQAGVVTTFAGSSTRGSNDGTGTAAQFLVPFGIAVDSAGFSYVTDIGNSRIRKISPAGVVTTLAGSTQGNTDGTGTAAQFNQPQGIAVDAAGTVYVADYGNNKIRKVSSSGVVTTLAGGTQGSSDGTGTAAQFNQPQGIAVDAAGTVYVADYGNHRIRKISPAGVVTTLAGSTQGYSDGTGAAAQFYWPSAISLDASGVIYVPDAGNNKIRKVSSSGVVTTLAGSTQGSSDGTGTAAQFNTPVSVTVDSSGVVYVADFGNNRIRKISPAGVVTTLAGSTQGNTDGTGTAAQFNQPIGLAVDSMGVVYVADANNGLIRKIQ